MKTLFTAAALLLFFSQNAQAPTAVPVAKEPHHHLVFQNSYVNVFRVSVPANSTTLLHQHDFPYVYVALGKADLINAIVDKPELHVVMSDGQVGYSPGHFAHIARTDSGIAFNNVTIELLHPQGEPRNICEKTIDGPLGNCQGRSSYSSVLEMKTVPVFEIGTTEVDLVQIGSRNFSQELTRKFPRLLVALTSAFLQVGVAGQPPVPIGPGETIWLPGGVTSRLNSAPSFSPGSGYLLINFREKGSETNP